MTERRCALTPLQTAHLRAAAEQVDRLHRQATELQRQALALIASEHGCTPEDVVRIDQSPTGVVLVIETADTAPTETPAHSAA